MKRYAIHPLAKLMPPMTAEEFTDLKADIRTNGIQMPIYLYEGKIIDGVHRYGAALAVGYTTRSRSRVCWCRAESAGA